MQPAQVNSTRVSVTLVTTVLHPTAFSLDTEQPDYDLDSEDETFVNKLKKKMEITALQFEEMIDRLEKGSGQQVPVSLWGGKCWFAWYCTNASVNLLYTKITQIALYSTLPLPKSFVSLMVTESYWIFYYKPTAWSSCHLWLIHRRLTFNCQTHEYTSCAWRQQDFSTWPHCWNPKSFVFVVFLSV